MSVRVGRFGHSWRIQRSNKDPASFYGVITTECLFPTYIDRDVGKSSYM